MLDFLHISTRVAKRGTIEVYPKFLVKRSEDLMIRGSDFYAIWDEDAGLWSTDEYKALALIDRELDIYLKEKADTFDESVRVLHMWDADTGMIDKWHHYCHKQQSDHYHMLDEKLIFSNVTAKKKDYASKRLNYPLEKGTFDAYDELMSVLYSPEERQKIEWAIGAVITGDSKTIQKFLVLYGAAGTGKSTVLNIIQKLFDGYFSVFDAKALGSASDSFALEAFKTNPLVAIQHDGDLSRIEDNTRLNSLVSHELMTVNEKFKSTYTNQFKSFLFMGTNKPVKITDGKSGLIRRLIDVTPTGKKVPIKEYDRLVKQIDFELGAIAAHCREVYLEYPNRYNDYVPKFMLGASNDFYNFVLDSYYIFKKEDNVTLKAAWEMYNTYCGEAKVPYPYPKRAFKQELMNYFWHYEDRVTLEDGSRPRNLYSGFRTDKFEDMSDVTDDVEPMTNLIDFGDYTSVFDIECSNYIAQYASENGTPEHRWSNVTTTLSDLDTSKLHYVMLPEHRIVIDFDIPDKDGNKSLELNLIEASKWPATYAELSKSGQGIHLHYIYNGDVSKLKRIYADHIEVKVFTGNSSLRRKLTKCNNLPVATISSGLPLKGEKQMINFDSFKNEKGLRALITKNLRKEIHESTKPSIDFIFKILEEAYESDLVYDVSDMYGSIFSFAASSTHQSDYCIKLVNKMHLQSKNVESKFETNGDNIVLYDVEVFPNLFIVNWKERGANKPVSRLINPTSMDIETLIKFNLVGFNCRRYDNHILYGRLLGYDNEQLYRLSQRIISGDRSAFFGEAYNISYTDVYDFSSKKQSLKKFEIELRIHHKELGLPWDEPVPEELWDMVAEYCDNDVIATEAVFEARQADWTARQILADVAGMSVNDTTNTLTTRIIFGKERNPQDQFNYRNLGEPIDGGFTYENWKKGGIPYFPGYKFENGISTYRDEAVGEGGYVFAESETITNEKGKEETLTGGMYHNVALLDIASMHPSSIVNENLFGSYTERFNDILQARIAIKHNEFDKARKMLNGALAKYLDDESKAKDLAQALKIAINSVYGLTSAKFQNPFRDIRNADNIVAKRGALFMVDLKHAVQEQGYTVAHIKTDSIKIPDATPEIIEFVTQFGKKYGYIFEHEATYERMCLVNDAVYIARYATVEQCEKLYSKEYVHSSNDICKDNKLKGGKWAATGTQFQVPYVFKTLFSHDDISFYDMCETKSVTSALYLGNEKDGYDFVGKVGRFCPMLPESGAKELCREKDGKYYSATGAKGYLWKEAEVVEALNQENLIDMSYYDKLCDDAIATISKYGDFKAFVEV